MNNLSNFTIAQAINSLCPEAKFILKDGDFSSIEWLDTEQTQPTEAEILAEIPRLQTEYDAQAYARSRASEYPPITDYLDGVVKGDQAQIDAYIAACQAVKAKYPKV
jgi:hypothetical protein